MANEYSKENVWKIMEDTKTVNFIRAIGLPDRKNIRIDNGRSVDKTLIVGKSLIHCRRNNVGL